MADGTRERACYFSETLPVVLSEDAVMRLLDAAASLRDKRLLGVMYATGLRVSEVARLCRRDFDFDRNILNVGELGSSLDI